MKCPPFVVLLCLLLVPWVAPAREPGAGTLKLADVLTIGLERNPALQSSYLRTLAAGKDVLTAEGIYETMGRVGAVTEDSEIPNPQFPGEGGVRTLVGGASVEKLFSTGTRIGGGLDLTQFEFTVPPAGDTELHNAEATLSLSQSLVRNWAGAVSESAIAQAEARYAVARLDHQRRREEFAAALYRSYWEIFLAVRQVEINARAIERAEQLLESNRRKVADGLLDETDVLAAEANLATRQVVLVELENKEETTRELLLKQMNIPPAEWGITHFDPESELASETPPVPEPGAAFELAMANRADLGALRQQKVRIEAEARSAARRALPEVELRGEIGRGGSGGTFDDSLSMDLDVWSVGIEASGSLSREGDKARLASVRLELEALDRDIENLQSGILVEIREVLRDCRKAVAQADATRKARDLHAAKLQQEQRKLAQGRSSTAVVLQYMDDLDFAEWAVAQALAGLQVQQARLELATGTLLAGRGDAP